MYRQIHFCWLLVIAIIFTSASSIHSDGVQQVADEEIGSSALRIPQFFHFGWFSNRFGKVYPTLSEYVARKKIYLANLVSIFVSQVAYKRKLSSYYLRVNQMSDRSENEISRILTNTHFMNMNLPKIDELPETLRAPQQNHTYIPVVTHQTLEGDGLSTDDRPVQIDAKVARELQEIAKDRNSSEVSKAVAEELSICDVPKNERKKRDLDWVKHLWGIKEAPKQQKEELKPLAKGLRSDLRRNGCFGKVKDQLDCGCCYAFSTLALIEYQHCLETGNSIDLSEQYVVDCGYSHNKMDGCYGANPLEVITFVNHFGLDYEKNYPYSGDLFRCPFPFSSPSDQMGALKTNFLELVEVNQDLVDELLLQIPILIGHLTSRDFFEYGGGVHNPRKLCRKNSPHLAVAVGIGEEDGLEYYLIRESQSEAFGEDGYYKLAKESADDCIVYWSTLKGLINGSNSEQLIKGPNKKYNKRLVTKRHNRLVYEMVTSE